MFSLHIDTARTWRGGQNQVLLTVNGLREIGQRAALVAHPNGELRRRAAEGLDLIPLAPRTEMDLTRGVAAVARHQAAAARRHSRARSARRGDGGARAFAERIEAERTRPAAGARRLAPRRFSSEGQFVLALEAPAGRLLHRGVRGDSADAARRRRAGRAGGDRARRHRRRARAGGAAGRTCTQRSSCRTARRSSATSRRSCRTRDSGTSIEAAHLVVQEVPDARFVILGEGELREQLERQVKRATTSRST